MMMSLQLLSPMHPDDDDDDIYTFSHGTQQAFFSSLVVRRPVCAKNACDKTRFVFSSLRGGRGGARKRSSLSDAQSVVLRKVAERSEALSSSMGARQKFIMTSILT